MYFSNNSTIAVIDSGIGGVSVLKQLIQKFNSGNYIYYADNLYMPYGNKSKKFIKERVESIINELNSNYHPDLIIIACNTASSSIDKNKFKNVVTLNFDEDYTYLTTPLTKINLANKKVIADDTLANDIEKLILNEKEKLKVLLKRHIEELNMSQIETLCLGCTHYELINDMFNELLPKTKIINNSAQIIEDIEMEHTNSLNVIYLTSKSSFSYIQKLKDLTFN